jgi:sec-independent protein translocase protein TatB
MFDVGFAEILLLSLVGLLVLGPERLPRVARTLGGMARKARSSWLNLKRSIEAEMRAEELKEPLRRFQQDVKSGVDDFRSNLESGLDSGLHPGSKPSSADSKSTAEEPGQATKEDDGNPS